MAIRLFFFLLVFANLLFFAWTRGYFGAIDENREPQRLAGQFKADKLRIVRNLQAPGTKKPDLACRVINGLNPSEAENLKSAMKASAGEATILPPAEPGPHRVVVADLANKAAAEKKAAELTRFGVTEQTTVELEGGRYEIVLGRFPTEAAARESLQGLVKRGIKAARVDSREQPAPKIRVEARGPAQELLRQLPQLIAPYANATIGDCPS
ncbi:MAG: hypothetical protein FIA96_03770 [Betaproteobacteria bacterium]|nr:hypothetical protein [Betaproteobacteria bacterium]